MTTSLESELGLSAASLESLGRDSLVIRQKIAELTEEIDACEKRAVTLKKRKVELIEVLSRIENLTSGAIAAIEAVAGAGLEPDTAISAAPPHLATGAGTTLAELIEGVMRSAGVPLHYKDILARVQSQGVDIGGKDPAATLLSILASRRYEGRFARSARGVYTLSVLRATHLVPRSKRRRRKAKAGSGRS